MARPRQITDEQILEGARAFFLDQGASASTAAIAESIGVSQAVLFKRFKTKEQLLIAALAPPKVPPFLSVVDAGPDDRPVCDQLVEIGVTIANFLDEIVPMLSVLGSSGIEPKRCFQTHDVPPPVLAHRALAGWFRRAQKAGLIRPCDPRTTAAAWLGSLHFRAFAQHVVGVSLPGKSQTAFVKELVHVLYEGIAPEVSE